MPLRWNLTGIPTKFVNQFVATVGPPTVSGVPDGIYLALGSIAPPAIMGDTPEARQPYIDAAMREGVVVDVHGRYYLSRARLEELITALESIRDKYDEAESTGITAGSSSALLDGSAK